MSEISTGQPDLSRNGAPAPVQDGISVVVTVRDDRDQLAELLTALAAQTYPPNEVVVVDGGSTDGTVELLTDSRERGVPLVIVEAPGSNIAQGRNLGVETAHLRPRRADRRGLPPAAGVARSIADGLRSPTSSVAPTGSTRGRRSSSAWPSRSTRRLRRSGREHDPRAVASSVRARLRDLALHRPLDGLHARGVVIARGFREDLYAGEDVNFSSTVVSAGLRAQLVPAAEAAWRPRMTWRANAIMYRTYARGDVRRGRRERHLTRALGWTTAPVIVIAGPPAARAAVGVAVAAYVGLPVARAIKVGLPAREWWRLPLLVAMKDLAQCVGAAEGLYDAARGRAQPAPD